MQKYQSFLLGFGCCFLLLLTILCFLIEMGKTERGSGRREIILAQSSNAGPTPQTKPERAPPKGNGRKD